VILSCPLPAHHAGHDLTPDQIERIVYAFSAALLDQGMAGELGPHYDDIDAEPCPLEMLSMAGDGEGFLEHVEQRVDQRRYAETQRQTLRQLGSAGRPDPPEGKTP
jgi:hypothetical protein